MKSFHLLTAGVLALTAAQAQADYTKFQMHPEQPYIGLDAQAARVDTGDKNATLTSVLLRAGTNFMPYLGVEAQVSYGVSDADFTAQNIAGTSFDCSAKNRGSYGVFLKPNASLANKMNVYGLLGANYSDIEAKCDLAGYKANSYGTSFAFGGGLGVMVSPTMSINAEVIRYDSDIDAANLGLRWYF
jgi:opacity protein-like surface antigen